MVQKIKQRTVFASPPKGAEQDFSTAEVNTGRQWLNGKDVYQKTINMGVGLNNNSLTVAHGITGLATLIELRGSGSVAGNFVPVPWADSGAAEHIEAYADATNVVLTSTGDWALHQFQVTLLYIKA